MANKIIDWFKHSKTKRIKKNAVKKIIKPKRNLVKKKVKKLKKRDIKSNNRLLTGISGLDVLINEGIPKGSSILIAGGPGSGKTLLSLQILNNIAKKEGNGLYLSLEESPEKLKEHMKDFGWNPEDLEKNNKLRIMRVDPFLISRGVEARLAKERGELKMSINEITGLVPKGFKPDWIVIDSLTALSAAFKDADTNYRIYIEQLFRYLENIGVTSLLISETNDLPAIYSKAGVEEFLADGVIVLYNIKHENIRENAIEILKLRGTAHKKVIVAMQILEHGIEIYPDQEIFKEVSKND